MEEENGATEENPTTERQTSAAEEIGNTKAHDGNAIPSGFSRLDNPDPAVEQIYNEGLGDEDSYHRTSEDVIFRHNARLSEAEMSEALLQNNGSIQSLSYKSNNNNNNEESEGCLEKYKGVWLIVLTLVLLSGIAGLVALSIDGGE